MRVMVSIVIHRPVETVFASVSDVDFIAGAQQAGQTESFTYRFFGFPLILETRSLSIKETRKTSPDPLGVGTTFVQIAESPSLSHPSFETTIQITEYDPPNVIACAFRGGPIPLGQIGAVLLPVTGGTKVTLTLKIEGGCYTFGGPLLAPFVKQQTKLNMQRLKERIESLPVNG
ncbi:MAG: hypothetical protein M3Z24_13345 [Chloroflexota bacterium]|nr:hypothetical protein [Chloroflexota bacterium]